MRRACWLWTAKLGSDHVWGLSRNAISSSLVATLVRSVSFVPYTEITVVRLAPAPRGEPAPAMIISQRRPSENLVRRFGPQLYF
jgi:hypothetical protein